MKRLLVILLAGASAIAGEQRITFTPNFESTLSDGVPMRQMYFQCGQTRIFYSPPGFWEISGWTDGIGFRDKRHQESSIRLDNAPGGMPKLFDKDGLERYRKLARTVVPAGAADVEMVRETCEPVEINGWKGFEACFSYSLSGKNFLKSMAFIKLDPEREIRLTVEGRAEDFEDVHEAAIKSLATWFEK